MASGSPLGGWDVATLAVGGLGCSCWPVVLLLWPWRSGNSRPVCVRVRGRLCSHGRSRAEGSRPVDGSAAHIHHLLIFTTHVFPGNILFKIPFHCEMIWKLRTKRLSLGCIDFYSVLCHSDELWKSRTRGNNP